MNCEERSGSLGVLVLKDLCVAVGYNKDVQMKLILALLFTVVCVYVAADRIQASYEIMVSEDLEDLIPQIYPYEYYIQAEMLAQHMAQTKSGLLDDLAAGRRCWYCKEAHAWDACAENPRNANAPRADALLMVGKETSPTR